MKIVFFLGMLFALGCGVKGPPLPPLVILPEQSDASPSPKASSVP